MGRQHGRSSWLGLFESVLLAHVPQHDSRRPLRSLRQRRLPRRLWALSERGEGHSLPRSARFPVSRGGNLLDRRPGPRVLFDLPHEIPIRLRRNHFRAFFNPPLSRRAATKPFSTPEPRFSSSPLPSTPFFTPSSLSNTQVCPAFPRGPASSTARRSISIRRPHGRTCICTSETSTCAFRPPCISPKSNKAFSRTGISACTPWKPP